MHFEGKARLDKKTKNLVKRLQPKDIAIIDHPDLDQISAQSLLETKVAVVVNASKFNSGRYPNTGPILLSSAGIHLIDDVGYRVFEQVKEGDHLVVAEGKIWKEKKLIAKGKVLTAPVIQEKMEAAKVGISEQLEKFAVNTLDYLQREKHFFLENLTLPETKVNFHNRHVLIVVRGYNYKADLQILRSYISEMKPILIGVDGGADALLAEGYIPHIIIGDMDSISDKALQCGAQLIVHAYGDGRAPGKARIESMGLPMTIFKAPGTSEDLALLLAYEKGAELIVAVGTHANLIEFLDKGREGMASTFLVRLKVGDRLVDAKGVNQLYRAKAKISHLLLLIGAALSTITVVILKTPLIRLYLSTWLVKLKLLLGL